MPADLFTTALRTVSVAVPVPKLEALTYTAPRELSIAPGMRVLVPLGTRTVTGCIVGVDDREVDTSVLSSLKPIARLLDAAPLVPSDTIALAMWTAEYYLCGPGEALALTMPPAARTRADAFKRQRVAAITDAGRAALDGSERLTEMQRKLLARLAAEVDALPLAELAACGQQRSGPGAPEGSRVRGGDPRDGRARPAPRGRSVRRVARTRPRRRSPCL